MWGSSVTYLFVSLLFIDAVSSALHPHWRLAWSDEFNSNSIDTTKWNVRTRIGNFYKGEQQYYHPDQVSVSNGSLVLTAINQTFGGQKYKSGLVDSQDKGHFTYARFEFRAKMARGKGMWPAIWMLSETKCWTLGAEIDMAEYRGSYPNEVGMFYHSSDKCCTQLGGCSQSQSKKLNEGVNYSSDFHTYAVEWHPTNMTWIIDGKVKFSFQTSSLNYAQDTSPHYFVFNSAVGGSYPGTPDATTPFPNYLMIDYIRVYVLRQSCSGSNVCSNHGCCDSSVLCRCNTGWTGASCEFWIGTYVNDFNAITNMDMIPNGWGNDVTMYLTNRAAIVSNALRLSLSNQSCPGDCGAKGYGSGGWESQGRHGYGTFTYIAKSSNVPGTGYSLSAAGDNPNSLEQISIVFPGANKNFVSLQSWKTGYHFIHNSGALIPLGFDASAAYHNYTIVYAATSFKLYVDTVLKYTATEVVPSGLLNMGAFYTAQPAWYGGTFKYTAVSYAYLDKATWEIAPGPNASC